MLRVEQITYNNKFYVAVNIGNIVRPSIDYYCKGIETGKSLMINEFDIKDYELFGSRTDSYLGRLIICYNDIEYKLESLLKQIKFGLVGEEGLSGKNLFGVLLSSDFCSYNVSDVYRCTSFYSNIVFGFAKPVMGRVIYNCLVNKSNAGVYRVDESHIIFYNSFISDYEYAYEILDVESFDAICSKMIMIRS